MVPVISNALKQLIWTSVDMCCCECYNYVNRHICKHLHALHMLNNQQHNSNNDKPIMLNKGMATILIKSPPDKENCDSGCLLVLRLKFYIFYYLYRSDISTSIKFSVHKWVDFKTNYNCWDLIINHSKSNYIIISRKPPMSFTTLPSLLLDGLPLELVSTFKYLGVTLTSNLSWSTHINEIWLRNCLATSIVNFTITILLYLSYYIWH